MTISGHSVRLDCRLTEAFVKFLEFCAISLSFQQNLKCFSQRQETLQKTQSGGHNLKDFVKLDYCLYLATFQMLTQTMVQSPLPASTSSVFLPRLMRMQFPRIKNPLPALTSVVFQPHLKQTLWFQWRFIIKVRTLQPWILTPIYSQLWWEMKMTVPHKEWWRRSRKTKPMTTSQTWPMKITQHLAQCLWFVTRD